MSTDAAPARPLVQLSGRGQITLPAEVRKALSLRSGDAFLVTVEGGRVILEPTAVVPIELYTEERIDEFLETTEMSPEELQESRQRWGV